MKFVYDSDKIITLTQTSSLDQQKKNKRSMLNFYVQTSSKDLNAFFFFENYLENLNVDKLSWVKSESTYWNLCKTYKNETIFKELFFFMIEQFKETNLKKVNQYDKYNVRLKISEKNAQNLIKILVKESHETKVLNINNDFHFDSSENTLLWINAFFKKVKRKYDNDKIEDDVRIIISKIW
jgi:hypothetical protein